MRERLKHFECSFPEKVEIIFSVQTKDYLRIEKFLHKKFKNKKIKREWFDLSEDDIRFIQTLNYEEDNIACMIDGFEIDLNKLFVEMEVV